MARKDSDHQKKSMSLLFRGKAIFKPLNTGRIDVHVACVREWVANIFFYTKNGVTIMIDAGSSTDPCGSAAPYPFKSARRILSRLTCVSMQGSEARRLENLQLLFCAPSAIISRHRTRSGAAIRIFPGVAQLVERVVWERVTPLRFGKNPKVRTPL